MLICISVTQSLSFSLSLCRYPSWSLSLCQCLRLFLSLSKSQCAFISVSYSVPMSLLISISVTWSVSIFISISLSTSLYISLRFSFSSSHSQYISPFQSVWLSRYSSLFINLLLKLYISISMSVLLLKKIKIYAYLMWTIIISIIRVFKRHDHNIGKLLYPLSDHQCDSEDTVRGRRRLNGVDWSRSRGGDTGSKRARIPEPHLWGIGGEAPEEEEHLHPRSWHGCQLHSLAKAEIIWHLQRSPPRRFDFWFLTLYLISCLFLLFTSELWLLERYCWLFYPLQSMNIDKSLQLLNQRYWR